MASIQSLFSHYQPPATNIATSINRRREWCPLFLAPNTLTADVNCIATNAPTTADRTQNSTIMLLKQLQKEERGVQRGEENGGQESAKMACRKVENPKINAFNNPNPAITNMPVIHAACNLSILSSGA
jgi:hypothetical protein